jgi:hypothetical protein
MKARARFLVALGSSSLLVLAVLAASACSKGHEVAGGPPEGGKHSPETLAISAPPLNDPACGHAVCADNFFIDAVPAGDCAAGSACGVTLKLVATGDFHINDEYPYRFKADEAAGLEFLGKDEGGKNTFSKAAGDWQKSEEKAGIMTVKFVPKGRGPANLAGTFKLSVCSPQNCLLDQRQVTAAVTAK